MLVVQRFVTMVRTFIVFMLRIVSCPMCFTLLSGDLAVLS